MLLLDEPFAGSDADSVAGIIEVIRTVQRRGHGVILVDHNVDLVASLVDRMMLLDRGRAVFDGDPPRVPGEPADAARLLRGGLDSGCLGRRPARTEDDGRGGSRWRMNSRRGAHRPLRARQRAGRRRPDACRAGAVTALVGPNGAGKSSLLLAAYGSVPSTGTVFLDGEEVSGLRTAARARAGIAMVPQGRQLFPRLNVADNLQVMAELLRLPRSAVDEAIDRFPILRTRLRSLVGVLSGGEQQMLVVTRALMGSPRVMLLDEMMTGLAPLIVRELADTVRGWRARASPC